ncbi:MAG: hypothetical protein IJF83_11145 [Methanobrevibacter sp.]|nr:hypothetical protein [Methanobrevibacter sp.]
MYYEAYSYHSGNTRPANEEDLNIFGLELEADNYSEERAAIFDNCIENDIITVPFNEHRTENLKIIQNDSSVWKEIIFRADTIENLLKRVTCLNNYGVNPSNFNNTSGTSAHIHINRNYLYDLNITSTNITKMFEFYAPVIFAISGRDRRNFERWASPTSQMSYNFINWEQRGRDIGNMSIYDDDRYYLVNLTRSSTIEMRGFSNKCSFDYETIKFYLEFVQFCIDEAVYMKNKLYRDQGETLKRHFLEWCPPEMFKKFNLIMLFKPDTTLYKLKEINADHYILTELRRARRGYRRPYELVQFLENYPELLEIVNHITISRRGVKNASNKILNVLQNKQGEYKNLYYQNAHLLEVYL